MKILEMSKNNLSFARESASTLANLFTLVTGFYLKQVSISSGFGDIIVTTAD